MEPTLFHNILTLQALRCGTSLQDAAEGLPTYGYNDLSAKLSAHLKGILFKTYVSIN